MKDCTRRADRDSRKISDQSRLLDPLVHKIRDLGVREVKAQPLSYSVCSASSTVGGKDGNRAR